MKQESLSHNLPKLELNFESNSECHQNLNLIVLQIPSLHQINYFFIEFYFSTKTFHFGQIPTSKRT